VPSLLAGALKETAEPDAPSQDFSALRWLVTTGEPVAPELCRQWLDFQPDVPLLNAYGPTECSDDVTHCMIREALPLHG
jgi:acyl-coenzyme A synthetase/AMP-(fatty) acid ligase